MCHATSNVPRKSKELVQELNHCNHLVLHHNWCAKHGLRFVVAWVHHIFCPSGILRHRRDQLWDPSPSFTVHLCHIWDYRNHSPSSIPSDSQMWTNWPQPKAIITLHNMFQLQLRLLVDIPLIHKPAFKATHNQRNLRHRSHFTSDRGMIFSPSSHWMAEYPRITPVSMALYGHILPISSYIWLINHYNRI